MTGKDLFEGMSWVDEKFIDEAEHAYFPKPRAIPWIRIASMAACLCLILFGLHQMLPSLEPSEVGNDGAMPQGVIEDIVDQNSQISIPAEGAIGEIPNVILYVEEMTAEGFIGTVTAYGVTDRLGLGRKVNVVIGEGTRNDSDLEDNAVSQDSKTDYTGCYVVVQFYEFFPDTNMIVVDYISIVEEE